MTWRPKLVALDVDGTIVNGDNELSDVVRDAVNAIRDAGIETVISTGRAIPGVMDTVGKLGFTDGLAVASNGAVVFRYSDDAADPVDIIHSVTFDAAAAVRRVLEEVPDAIVAVEKVGEGFRVNRPFPETEFADQWVIDDVEKLIAEPVTRVVIRSTDHTPAEFTAIVHDLGLTGTNYFIGYSAWLDLAPEGVSKASGLDVVCERLGIAPTDVLAVGDGNNDLEMLQWAGRGVAMGQSPESLRDVADAVTGSIDEDGLAAELSKYV
ncbi:HAD family hydrolase [Aeromicrobium fastidiosum]|uniref:HAD family phosphatase n=1 Tax=Aeromicrobium fastidiosum TaxID=52699 RepID=A0A641AUA9_9ACTN|nr:HAD family hydrolase [Aeromicrobium fastidiosum]KAA1380448.1 HAD family phosphatase [Aeromicrobium fastidiosum]MBP2390029.1 Cof subfamily protein (haloacid dehalogenase superfamily) [Aeromicrobium fastidiosum]